jgi:hypothetical protein
LPGYRPRSRSSTSAHSASMGGLTRAVNSRRDQASRHCHEGPRQKQALTTTFESSTTRFTRGTDGVRGEPRGSPSPLGRCRLQ